MLFFGTGLHPTWWLTWLAPLPVLLVAPRLRAWLVFIIAALAWFVGGLNMWHVLRAIYGIPIPVILAFLIVPALIFGLAVLLFRTFIRRGALWRATLVFPMTWVAYEYLSEMRSPHCTFGNLGYTQMDCLPVLQIVALVGIWGISFCIFLLPAALAILFSQHGSRGQRINLAASVVVFLAIVLGYGAYRLQWDSESHDKATIGLMATDSLDLFPRDDQTALKLMQLYAKEIERWAGGRVDVIVLPEKIALVSDKGTAQLDALCKSAASRAGAHIVVGVDRGTASRRSNEARLYSPQGKLRAVYVKHHLIPPYEDADVPGTELTVLNKGASVWGIEICKDLDFPALARRNGAQGVGLLLVPAWDFLEDGWLHDRMAVMRGVESGFSIARVAKQGLLSISDDRGRVLAEATSSATSPFASLVATVPVRHTETVYLLCGDWFGWANAVGLAAIVGSLWFRRRRPALLASSK
jgi:apolipoprotein N-acyltransferase